TMMDWDGGPIDKETVNYSGTDISNLYPWFFDKYVKQTPTNNDYISPWDIDWINVTALNPTTPSNYTLNSVFNYYVMSEGTVLQIPLNASILIQIDILINSIGPKILKYDWLTDDPTIDLLDDFDLISPSGKLIDNDYGLAQHSVVVTSVDLFRYITFVANEKGTYRLLMKANYEKSTYLTMEFLDTPISNLPLNTLKIDGNGDEDPNVQEGWDLTWQNRWYRFNGEKGDLFKLDLGIDYTGLYPAVNLWTPCENGYIQNSIGTGVSDIYFLTTGTAYLSFIDETFDWWYRYSLFLSECEMLNYTLGNDVLSTKILGNQRKAIEFEVEEEGYVMFNYTLSSPSLADPEIYAGGTSNGFLYEDSNSPDCYSIIEPIVEKVIGSDTFYYYYLPNGTYKAF
ncbi:unnamed protein product, partial [marine sediment metagenome]